MKLGGMILISLEGCERMACTCVSLLSRDRKEVKTREGKGREMLGSKGGTAEL